MSSITWKENRLFQHVGNHHEELGYVKYDENSKNYVLWLNDTCGVLGLNGGPIRGDEFPSMEAAKQKAASSPSAFILHYLWMRKGIKQELIRAEDDHWEEISPHLPHDASKDDWRNKFFRFIEEIKASGEKNKKIEIVKVLIDLIKLVKGMFGE